MQSCRDRAITIVIFGMLRTDYELVNQKANPIHTLVDDLDSIKLLSPMT